MASLHANHFCIFGKSLNVLAIDHFIFTATSYGVAFLLIFGNR